MFHTLIGVDLVLFLLLCASRNKHWFIMYWTPWCNHYFCLIFWRTQLQILAWRQATLRFCVVFLSLQANAGVVSQIRPLSAFLHILSNSLFTDHPATWRYVIWATNSVIKLIININESTVLLIHLWDVSSGSQDSSVVIATGYRVDSWGSNPGRDEIFLFSTMSRLALEPAQPPI
jgi:hypothetical protein